MQQIWRLKHFLAAADAGSIQGAARQLSISQPALTKSIRLLETYLDATLFDRSARGVILTELGRDFYVRARQIEEEWNAGLADVSASKQGARGVLRLGVGPTYAAAFLPKVLERLTREYPNIEISVRTGVGTELLPALRTGEISLYAGGLDEGETGDADLFDRIPLYTQSNVLVAARGHPAFRGPPPPLDEVAQLPWVRLSYDALGSNEIERFFVASGCATPRFSVTTGSLAVALDMVQSHGFLTGLPAPFLYPSLGLDLETLPYSGYKWQIPTGLTLRKSITSSAVSRTLITLFKQQVQQFVDDTTDLRLATNGI
ncbi:MAG: LysR family transcriptional regulator [Rhodobacteraceae bacterium]|nr:LysR family transcriptional regulator [Paracoccaceae bacterium]